MYVLAVDIDSIDDQSPRYEVDMDAELDCPEDYRVFLEEFWVSHAEIEHGPFHSKAKAEQFIKETLKQDDEVQIFVNVVAWNE